MKKLISLMLTLAMILSMTAVSVSSVSAAESYLNETFNYADAAAMQAAGWGDYASGSVGATLNAVKEVVTNKQVAVSGGAIGKPVSVPNTGKYVLNINVVAGPTTILGVKYEDSNRHNVMEFSSGNIVAWNADKSGGAALSEIGATCVSGTEYNVEIVLDYTTSGVAAYELTVKNATGNVVGTYKSRLFSTSKIAVLTIGEWNETNKAYFKSIVIDEYTEPVVIDKEVPIEDNFDAYADAEAAQAAGWIKASGTHTLEAVDEAHGSSLKIAGGRATREVTIEPNSGMYKLSFSTKTANEMVVHLVDNTTNFDNIDINFYTAMKVQIDGTDAAEYTDRWYDTEMILNTADGTYTATIKADGATLASGSGTYKDQGTGLSKIHFSSWGTNSGYVDNFKIEAYTPPVEEPEETEVFTEDFNDYADASSAFAGGWKDYASNAMQEKLGFAAIGSATEGDSHGNSMYILDGRVAHDFNETEKDGKYKVTFSVYAVNELFAHVFNGSSTSFTYAVNFNEGSVYVDPEKPAVASYTKNTWYNVEVIVDIDEGMLTTTVYNTEGSKVASGSKALTDGKGAAMHRILFGAWGEDKDTASYVDDIKIERYYAPPVLTQESVTLTDISGNKVEDITKATPGIKSIALNFGTAMKEDTIKVTLDGEAVTGSLSGAVYIIPTGPVLDGGKTYELKVASGATNTDEQSMGEFVYEFTTVQNNCTVVIDGLYSGDTKLDNEANKISTLTAGSVTAKLSYANATKSIAKLTCMVAFYEDDMLVDAKIIPVGDGLASGAADVISNPVTLPDMTDIDEIAVYAWDATTTMLPYCSALTLTK